MPRISGLISKVHASRLNITLIIHVREPSQYAGNKHQKIDGDKCERRWINRVLSCKLLLSGWVVTRGSEEKRWTESGLSVGTFNATIFV